MGLAQEQIDFFWVNGYLPWGKILEDAEVEVLRREYDIYTPPNATDRQRRAFVIHFMQPGTRNKNGEVMRPGFKNPVLRMSI